MRGRDVSTDDGGVDLRELFRGHQATLEAALRRARSAIPHPTLKGDTSEGHWREMLEKHLPRRYRACKGLVVDSRNGVSDQMDIIIHDAHYCPLFLAEGGVHFVPAESVYAVFEVKQELNAGYVRSAAQKVASVRQLLRTSAPIPERGAVQPPRPLPPILGGVLALTTGWVSGLGDEFRAVLHELSAPETLDLGCVLEAGAFETPEATGQRIVQVFPQDAALLAFFLRLIHRLQALGTVPAIDWAAYGRVAFPST